MLVVPETNEPLYKKFGIFTEASTKKRTRKPKIINASPSRALTDFTKDSELDEVDIDNTDTSDLSIDDLEDYTSGLEDEELETDDFEDDMLDDETQLDNILNDLGNMINDDDGGEEDTGNENPDESEPTPEQEPTPQDQQPEGEIPDGSESNVEPTTAPEGEQTPEEPEGMDIPDGTQTDTQTDPATQEETPEQTDVTDPNAAPADTDTPPEGMDIPDGTETNTDQADPNAATDQPQDQTEPVMDDNTDMTAGADGGDTPQDQQPDQTQDPNAQGKEFKKDDVRKYVLFQQFTKLHTSITNYISKLESSISDDGRVETMNYEIKTKFQELSSLVYDYLVLKFSSDSYMSNKYFYEQTKAAILILFQLLNNSHNEIEALKKSKK